MAKSEPIEIDDLRQLATLVFRALSDAEPTWYIDGVTTVWKSSGYVENRKEGRVLTLINLNSRELFHVAIFKDVWGG